MKAVQIVQGTAVPLERNDVDTDQIIPSDWLKRVERTGFEKGLFSEWRDDPAFVLNDEQYAGASIMVAGANFGTGSSREHAVWAIQQGGFDAVISPRFGPIFKNNSTKNGLVPVELAADEVAALTTAVKANPETEIVIDVARGSVEAPGANFEASFVLSDAIKERLLNGLDDIALTLRHAEAIDSFESARPSWMLGG